MSQIALDRAGIAERIPHHGDMCLLDAVLEWDEHGIVCQSDHHRNPDNPLRADGRLGAATGVEFAAQAMAVHGALLANQASAPKKGYITRVQRVQLFVSKLDDVMGPLTIRAERQMGNEQIVRYGFTVEDEGRALLKGEATVMLDAG